MLRDFPLSKITTVQTGGIAKCLLKVATLNELIAAIDSVKKQEYLIIGGGSNLIFPDSGYDGIILKNELVNIDSKGSNVTVSCGTLLQDLVNFTIDKGLGGIHKLTGIPGTVGGAIYGNAGAYGQTISDHITSVKVLKRGKIVINPKSKCGFGYRTSIFKQTKEPIIEVQFKLTPADKKGLQVEAAAVFQLRLEKYPPNLKCPGSFFMNVPINSVPRQSLDLIPEDKIRNNRVHVGWLLESVGAKGLRFGGVEVASYHGNLFINKHNGTSTDYFNLAKELAKRVKEKYNVKLKPEVQIIAMPPILSE